MRSLLPLLLLACTPTDPAPPPRKAARLQLDVRLPPARHGVAVQHATFVWPAGAPETLGEGACPWWTGRDDRGALPHLAAGRLDWGVITLTPTEVALGRRRLAPLEGGRPRAEDVDATTLLPLSTALAEARDRLDGWYAACGEVRRDWPALAVDADVPVSTVARVLATLSVHRFDRAALLVGDRDPGERPATPSDEALLLVLRQRGETVDVMDVVGERRATGPATALEAHLGHVRGEAPFGCTLVVPAAGTRTEALAATLDAAVGYGSRRQGVLADPPAPRPPPPAGSSPTIPASPCWSPPPSTTPSRRSLRGSDTARTG